jgi:GTP pyrophosphokinase
LIGGGKVAYSERFEAALVYAAQLHRHQTRKATSAPYVTHLLAVASLVGEHTDDEDAAIAALLHDAIEDQGHASPRETIGERFGERVLLIVEACTDADVVPKPPWRPRKERYVARLRDPQTPTMALLVSAADKLHNARCTLADVRRMGPAAFVKFNADASNVLWYYNAVWEALDDRLPGHPLVEELGRVVKELHELASRFE